MKAWVLFSFIFFFATITSVKADAIFTNEGQEPKGVIVEEYNDRIVLSTDSGELPYFKKDIEKIEYDDSEKNLLKLAVIYKDKGDYKTALYYYQSAYDLNPSLKEAQDGTLLMNNMILQKREKDLREQVSMKQDTEERIGKVPAQGVEPASLSVKDQELRNKVGISLSSGSSGVIVEKVVRGSPASEAGLRRGDGIVAVWGKYLKYMQLQDVYNVFLNGTVSELKMTIAREVTVAPAPKGLFGGAERAVGGKFSMELQGLTVSDIKGDGALARAGIIQGDRIIKIQFCSTRYMSLDAAYRLIEQTKGREFTVEFQREYNIWKRG